MFWGARLKGRHEDSDETIRLRLKNAEEEMEGKGDFRYIVVNSDLDAAYGELREIILIEGRDRSE